MTRLHADDIDVERGMVARFPADCHVPAAGRIEGPARFCWGQRWYSVQAVLDHWVEAGNWWRRTARPAATPADPGVLGIGALGIDDGEREVWRVEATPGRGAPPGVFDLQCEGGSGRWSLIRVHD